MVDWGKLNIRDNIPQLSIISIDNIMEPISAVPYKTEDTIDSAHEWLFLKNRNNWANIFLHFMKETLPNHCNEKILINGKRKR